MTIEVVLRSGETRQIEPRGDLSLMELLREAGVDDIAAVCGGNCSCATCHVYLDADGLPDPSETEEDILDMLLHRQVNSRLSCQVRLSAGQAAVTVAPEE